MSDFPIQNFFRLKELFQSKKWDKNDNEKEIFRRFGILLNNLSVVEQNLILDLCDRYRWIPVGEYMGCFIKMFTAFAEESLREINHIYFFPVIKPEDEDKTKSGNVVIYLYNALKHFLPKNLQDIKVTIVEQFDKIDSSHLILKKDELLILMDDFIGSGSTITSTFTEIDKNASISYAQIRVFSIAIMQEAVNLLSIKGIPLYCEFIEQKGITGFYEANDEANHLRTMQKIEKMTVTHSKFKMGYNQSESLVTMARTPNNTFSIFWSDHRKNRDVFSAPFKR